MCNPMIFMLAATAVSAVGQMQAGQAQAEMYNEQAQQTLNEGAYRQDAAKAQAENIRKAGRAQVGETRASLAASGVKLGEGTPLELEKDIIQSSEEDALSAILSGKRTMSTAQTEARLLDKAGSNAKTNAAYGAASTVLAGGAQVAKNWKFGSKGA